MTAVALKQSYPNKLYIELNNWSNLILKDFVHFLLLFCNDFLFFQLWQKEEKTHLFL